MERASLKTQILIPSEEFHQKSKKWKIFKLEDWTAQYEKQLKIQGTGTAKFVQSDGIRNLDQRRVRKREAQKIIQNSDYI